VNSSPRTTPPAGAAAAHWGLPDVVGVWLGGIVAGFVFASVGLGISGDRTDNLGALTLGLSFAGQYGGWLAAAIYVSRRKGSGSLLTDYGLVVRPRDIWAVPAGIGVLFLSLPLILPLQALLPDHGNTKQSIVNDLETSHGAKLALLVLAAGVLAPFFEELLFRGLLLRALRRRMDTAAAITVSALAFALVHPLLDPTLATLTIVPALFLLGALSAILAVRSGELSQSVWLHVGFNLLTTLGALHK
jgi:membrane protease YdiL (CAAX protease family)